MIYFLSGLLIIHGIVCLVSAFFPLYPPVFLFYVFFPGHFAIRMIIILLIGAAQLVYGVYLALGKRWWVKWYWPAIATVVITGLLLVFPVLQNPGLFGVSTGKDEIRQPILFKETLPIPAPGEEAADDIIPTPGGLAYRANVHQQGVENPRPPIESADVVLGGGLDDLNVSYRDYIKTEARETRNNIVRIRKEGGLFDRNLALYSINVPTGITLTDGGRGVGLPGTLGAVLVIEISPDVQPEECSFGIGIEIDGKNYGTIHCMIEVIEDTQSAVQVPPADEERFLRPTTKILVHKSVIGKGQAHFEGTTNVYNATLQTQLYQDEKPLDWWPANQDIKANGYLWEITVTLAEELPVESSYVLKIWAKDNPSLFGRYGFDLRGPPSMSELGK